jgi:hypothetical protein
LGPETTNPRPPLWVGGGVWGFWVCGSPVLPAKPAVGRDCGRVGGVGGGCGCGGCALFENYTVDASIFVVKLLRADGGCLGTRSR